MKLKIVIVVVCIMFGVTACMSKNKKQSDSEAHSAASDSYQDSAFEQFEDEPEVASKPSQAKSFTRTTTSKKNSAESSSKVDKTKTGKAAPSKNQKSKVAANTRGNNTATKNKSKISYDSAKKDCLTKNPALKGKKLQKCIKQKTG